MKYFVSFIEEGIFNQKYLEYTGGRVEIYDDNSQYAIDELRFFTKDKAWFKFREIWDFKEVTEEQLEFIKKEIKDKYYETP